MEITPLEHPPQVTIAVPGSKSETNRAFVLSALASRWASTRIDGALICDDSTVMLQCLKQLGYDIRVPFRRGHNQSVVFGKHAKPTVPRDAAELHCGNSGTTMRFLTALVALGRGRYFLDGDARMRERPIGDLLSALRQLGVTAKSIQGNDCPPVVIDSRGLHGGTVRMRADVSSQFLSAVMMVGPFADEPVDIIVEGCVVSAPYVKMTQRQMWRWGFIVEQIGEHRFQIKPQEPDPGEAVYRIEPDASAASYWFAAAAIAGGGVGVRGFLLPENGTLQGDAEFVRLLERMGCSIDAIDDTVWAFGQPLRGIDVDMNAISDTVMTLAAVACFAEGPTTIRNVAHIRLKESDRIAALATELRKLGVEVEEYPDGLRITPRPMHGAEIETYNDHRMAMSFALIGLKVPGVQIKNPGCVAKTYPGFWSDLARLRMSNINPKRE